MLARHFRGTAAHIIVAVGLDEHTDALLRSASSLARRSGMSLRLVHVVEPWVGGYWSTAVAGGIPMMDIVQNVETEQIKMAEDKLTRLVERYGKDISCNYAVLRGIVADAILEDAAVSEAAMLITGSAGEYQRFIPRGFSTALSLLAHAPIPVLVVPRDVELNFERPELKLLVADDLSTEARRIVATAFAFAAELDSPRLLHFHVNAMGADHVEDTMRKAVAAQRDSGDPGMIARDVAGTLLEAIKKGLAERVPQNRLAFDRAGGTYQVKIANGHPIEEVNAEAERLGADVLIFGRHQTFHRRPFLIGRVPFHAMLSRQQAVMVLPLEEGGQ